MKIEWLNESRTKAIVTKGWIRARCAEVYRGSDAYWRFAVNDERVPSLIDMALDNDRARIEREIERAMRIDPWQPVRRMPRARLLERP